MKVRATHWNTALHQAGALMPRTGKGINIYRSPRETVISLTDQALSWRHPWHTLLSWIDDQWQFNVKAGFVNGFDPVVPSTAPEPTEQEPRPKDLGMIDVPWIPVRGTRPVGSDGSYVPPFFRKLGVKQVKMPSVSLSNFDSFNVGDILQAADDAANNRKLQAFDIFVTMARATYKMEPTFTNNIVLGSLLEYTVTYDISSLTALGTRPRLNQSPKMDEPSEPDLSARLSGIVGDDGLDRLPVATGYLLAPAENPSDKPDRNWTPYVQHKCFWNATHQARNAVPINLPQLSGMAGLFALTSRYTIAPAASFAVMEAEMQRITAAVFNSSSNRGVFWTT
jgi:hypothetical protein